MCVCVCVCVCSALVCLHNDSVQFNSVICDYLLYNCMFVLYDKYTHYYIDITGYVCDSVCCLISTDIMLFLVADFDPANYMDQLIKSFGRDSPYHRDYSGNVFGETFITCTVISLEWSVVMQLVYCSP